MSVVSVTGSRRVNEDDVTKIITAVRDIVSDPSVTEIHFGGALGADTEALTTAIMARPFNRTSRLHLVVVVPGCLYEQPTNAAEAAKWADEVIELKLPSSDRNRFRTRNQHLVYAADMLLAFWNGDERSGTAMTMRMAKKKGIPMRVVMIGGAK